MRENEEKEKMKEAEVGSEVKTRSGDYPSTPYVKQSDGTWKPKYVNGKPSEWLTTKTLNDGESWKPQGELHIMSGKPLPVIKDLNEEDIDEQ